MQTKLRTFTPNFGVLKTNNREWLYYSLLVVLVGVFLLPKIAYFSSVTDERIIELTNKTRAENGLASVTASQYLAKAAYDKAEAILLNQDFSHNIGGKKFSSWVRDTGYSYSYVGENLAIDFVTSEGMMKAWLASPTHRQNILNEYFEEIGVAVVEGEFRGSHSILVVQVFAKPVRLARVLGQSEAKPPEPLPLSLENKTEVRYGEQSLTHAKSSSPALSAAQASDNNFFGLNGLAAFTGLKLELFEAAQIKKVLAEPITLYFLIILWLLIFALSCLPYLPVFKRLHKS